MSRLFLPAGTNFVLNPDFVGDANSDGLVDLAAYGQNIAGTPTFSLSGGVQRCQYTGVAGDAGGTIFYFEPGVTPAGGPPYGHFSAGDDAAGSIVMRGSQSGCTILLALLAWSSAPAFLGWVNVPVTLTADEQRVEVLYPNLPATTDFVTMRAYAQDIVEGDTFVIYYSEPQLEKASVPTPFFSGASVGCSWDAGENQSPSLRAASVLDYALLPGMHESGTIALKIVPEFDADDGVWHTLFTAGDGALHHLQIVHTHGGVFAAIYASGSSSVSATEAYAGTWGAGSEHIVVARWTAGESLDLYVDGRHEPQVANALTDTSWAAYGMGFNRDGSNPANAAVGPAIVSADDKPMGWVQNVTASSGAKFADARDLVPYLAAGDLILPLESSGDAYRGEVERDHWDVLLVAEGDSMSAEATWPAQIVLPTDWDVVSFGVGGQTIQQMAADAAAQIDPLLASQPQTHKLLCFFDYGALAADAADWVAYGQARRAAGWKVITCTLPSNISEDANWWAFNNWIRANYTSFADGLADLGADPTIGAVGAYANATYFNGDGIHCTAAGNAVVASVIKAAADTLL